MLKLIVFLSFSVAVCYGAPEGTPGGTGTYCGETPGGIFKCMNSPTVLTHALAYKCKESTDECSKMTCIFRETGWMDGNEVNKVKVSAHFDQFAKDHPEWLPAVQRVKTACLGPVIAPQGFFVNCPAYDIMHCAFSSFIKRATPSQWSTSTECKYPREYAAACPVCPSNCYAPQIPIGSCAACYNVPANN